MVVQPDDRILIGNSRMARFYSDGTVDTQFNPLSDSSTYSFALFSGGKMLVGGAFHRLSNNSQPYLGLLKANGAFR